MMDVVTILESDPTGILTNAELAAFAKGHPLHFAPGSAFRYSNTNYILLALVLEVVTGEEFSVALREHVFDPLGMSATSTANHDPIGGDLAIGYMISGSDYDAAPELAMRWEAGSGGQWSTAADLTRFMRGIMETDAVFYDAGRQIMLAGSAHSTYGMGIDTSVSPSGPVVWHNGRLLGYSSFMAYYEDYGLAVSMVANAVVSGGDAVPAPDALLVEIMEEVFAGRRNLP